MTKNFIGQTIYVAEAYPTANTSTAFASLTWVKVEGLITLPQLGVTHSMIDVPDLQTGFTSAVKGAGLGVDTTATFRNVASDAGQEDIKNSADSQAGILSIKIVNGSGTAQAPVSGDPVLYAQGIAHSHQPNQGDNASFEGFSIGFRQNAPTIAATEPA